MALSWNEIKDRALKFSKEWADTSNEEADAKPFLVEFFKDQKNLENINCYSNEGDKWEKSKTNILNNTLTIQFRTVFKPRRGRINCSLNDNGKWRWFGVQFPIKEN